MEKKEYPQIHEGQGFNNDPVCEAEGILKRGKEFEIERLAT